MQGATAIEVFLRVGSWIQELKRGMLVVTSSELRKVRHRVCILRKRRPRGECWQKYARSSRLVAIFVRMLRVVQKVAVVVVHARIRTVGSERKGSATGNVTDPLLDEIIALYAIQEVADDVDINGLVVLDRCTENRVVRYDFDEQRCGF